MLIKHSNFGCFEKSQTVFYNLTPGQDRDGEYTNVKILAEILAEYTRPANFSQNRRNYLPCLVAWLTSLDTGSS